MKQNSVEFTAQSRRDHCWRRPVRIGHSLIGRVLFERATLRWKAQSEGRAVADLPGGFGDVVMVDAVEDARNRGVLHAHEPFEKFTRHGVLWPSGEEKVVDAVMSCTGFQADLSHLNALSVVNEAGYLAH